MIWINGKNKKNHTCWQENQCPEKKSERKVCLLFWLDIYSIISTYFIPIIVLKIKTRGFLSLFFIVFLLYSRAIIGAYFIQILDLKFQLKIIVKTSAKTRGFLSLFFLVFILYSRAILGFSLSPSLLLCAFHCFNC